MTDNEKARKYANYMIHHSEIPGERNRLKQAYLDGLTEGRKEQSLNLNCTIDTLEETICEKDEQIEQLSNDNHVLKTAFITQREQIEKMKNVGNCRKAMTCTYWNEKQTTLGYMKFCKDCKDWELSE